MEIGQKVSVSDCNFYDADGVVIGQTKCFWRVEVFNHKTMGDLWESQNKHIILFHKKKGERGERLQKGFSKKCYKCGDFLSIHPVKKEKRELELLIEGFPCQSLSTDIKNKGFNVNKVKLK